MKAMWFLPFTYAAGAEGFALFAAYLIGVLVLLYLVRCYRKAKHVATAAPSRLTVPPRLGVVPADVYPAM